MSKRTVVLKYDGTQEVLPSRKAALAKLEEIKIQKWGEDPFAEIHAEIQCGNRVTKITSMKLTHNGVSIV